MGPWGGVKMDWEEWKGTVRFAIRRTLEDAINAYLRLGWIKLWEELDLYPYVGRKWYFVLPLDVGCYDPLFINEDPIAYPILRADLKNRLAMHMAAKKGTSSLWIDDPEDSHVKAFADLLAWGTRYIPERVMALLEALDELSAKIRNLS